MNSSIFSKYWPWYFFTAAIESLLAMIVLLMIPSEHGISAARLMLAAIFLFFIGAGAFLGFRRADGFDRFARPSVIAFAALISLVSGWSLFLLRYLQPEKLLPIFERLSPLLWYLTVLGLQSVIFLLLVRNGFDYREIHKRKAIYSTATIVLIILILTLGIVAVTGLGITRDPAYWGEPGVPILGWQAVIAILLGFGLLILTLFAARLGSSRIVNFVLPIGIWLTATICWLSVPAGVLQNSFYAPITPPANIPFPYSDAGFYDYLSQSLLIGSAYLGGVPPRPLYVLFLAGLHTLFGQDYLKIITAQTCLLALFPVSLYFLGKKLHSSAAGLTVATLAIFRELVSLWISSNTRVANSKILTTDFPTALGITLVCLLAIFWLERKDLKSSLLMGGGFGLLLLLRSQSLIILPVLLLLAWFAYQRQTRQWLVGCMYLLIALSFTISPWLAHNSSVVGRLAFDDPTQLGVIYSQYSFTGNLDFSRFDIHTENLGLSLLRFTLQNPGFVAGFITNHFLNTEIGGLLALPLIERFDGLFAPINLYWIGWDGSLVWYNSLLIVLYLAVIAVGLGAVWQRLRWLGLLPLAFNLGYALSNGIARFSSWRYNLPADWTIYFYFGIGAMEILGGLALLFGAKVRSIFPAPVRSKDLKPGAKNKPILRSVLILIILTTLGALPWLAKGFVSPRYLSTDHDLIEQLVSRGEDRDQISEFLDLADSRLLEGRLLYPRFYRRNLGLSSTTPWPAYELRDFSRIGFLLLNTENIQAVFPTRDPISFPQGADAIILGCQRTGYLDVRLIVFPEYDLAYSSAPLVDDCRMNTGY